MLKDVTDFVKKYELPTFESPSLNKPILDIRIAHLQEELAELIDAAEADDEVEVVDALLDLVYIALGTCVMLGFDTQAHWNEIQRANMSKVKGVTKRGHNVDVKKPDGWVGPQHERIINGS